MTSIILYIYFIICIRMSYLLSGNIRFLSHFIFASINMNMIYALADPHGNECDVLDIFSLCIIFHSTQFQ